MKTPPLSGEENSDFPPAFVALIEALAELSVEDYLVAEGFILAPTLPPELDDQRTCLYRHFDSAGALLYVGISNTPRNRRQGHRSVSPWFAQVVEIREEWFDDRRAAMAAERKAIKTERPQFNRQGA